MITVYIAIDHGKPDLWVRSNSQAGEIPVFIRRWM